MRIKLVYFKVTKALFKMSIHNTLILYIYVVNNIAERYRVNTLCLNDTRFFKRTAQIAGGRTDSNEFQDVLLNISCCVRTSSRLNINVFRGLNNSRTLWVLINIHYKILREQC